MFLSKYRSRFVRTLIVVISMSFVFSLFAFLPANASGETISVGTTITGRINTAIPINSVVINSTGDDTIPVRLHVASGSLAMSTMTGLTFTGPNTGATLEFSGTRTNVNNALATLTFTKNSISTVTLEVSLTAPGEVVYEGTGHIYEAVNAPGGITWNAANTAALGRTKYGATGYLATIMSSGENQYIADRVTQPGWMGASDAAVEGDWKWVTGPETGISFWTGDQNGSVVSGRFANWNSNEPNNSGNNEDCAQLLTGGSGKWNDLPCTGTTLNYYIVEYGAPGNMPNVQSTTLDINVADVPSAPTNLVVNTGIGSADVIFNAPASNGSPITGYKVISTPGNIEATGVSTQITVEGLTPGVSYTFRAIATNAVGDSLASIASNSITPTSPAQWDDNTITTPRLDVAFNDGVSATGYPEDIEYTIVSGSLPDGLSLNSTTGAITGMPTKVQTYSFTIQATNGIGTEITKHFEGKVADAPALSIHLDFGSGADISDNLSTVVSGTGLKPGSEYNVYVESTPTLIGSGTITSSGDFSTRVYLPKTLHAGSHRIYVTGTGVNNKALSASAFFGLFSNGKVAAVSGTNPITADQLVEPPSNALPITGANIGWIVLVAVILLGIGFVLMRNKPKANRDQ